MFASAKNYQRKAKIIELVSTTVWDTSAINVYLGYNCKMVGYISNSTFVLKFFSGRPTSFLVAYFKLWGKSCERTSNIGEVRLSRSIKNASPFIWTMADCICSSSYFVVSLQRKRYIYIYIYIYMYVLHKTSGGQGEWGKNLWHQGEGSTNGRLGRTK